MTYWHYHILSIRLQLIFLPVIKDNWQIYFIYTYAQTRRHKSTHTHTHVGSIKDYNSFWNKILPHVTHILVLPTIHLKLVFLNSFWHVWKTFWVAIIACSSFVHILSLSIFPSRSSSYLVWIIYACVLLCTVFKLSSNTLTSAQINTRYAPFSPSLSYARMRTHTHERLSLL